MSFRSGRSWKTNVQEGPKEDGRDDPRKADKAALEFAGAVVHRDGPRRSRQNEPLDAIRKTRVAAGECRVAITTQTSVPTRVIVSHAGENNATKSTFP